MVEKRWKYQRVKVMLDSWQVRFDEAGMEGWELVSVVHERDLIVGYFKMEREPEEEEIAENLIEKGLNLMD